MSNFNRVSLFFSVSLSQDPNTSSYKLPTFTHSLSSKCNLVCLSDVEKGHLREARKKSSTSSIYSLSSLDSLNFNEDGRLPYDNETSIAKGDVVKLPNGCTGDMISCLDSKPNTNESIDNPNCRGLLVDINTSDEPRNPYKNAEVNGMTYSGTSIKSKSNDYSRDLTSDQDNSKNRNHTKCDDHLPLHHNLLHRHHSQPNSNHYQNHYTHFTKRHQSLRQQHQKSENTHIDGKSKANFHSGDPHYDAVPQNHTYDSILHPSPSKVPLLSSPVSEDTPEEEIEFYSYQQSKCQDETEDNTPANGLITESTDSNNIPLRNMQNPGAGPKHINFASNPAYLNMTILDENNCWLIYIKNINCWRLKKKRYHLIL